MLPVQITIKDIPTSPAVESHIRKKVEKLQKVFSRITSCRVVVEQPQRHKHQGKLFNVRIDVAVPGKEFVATRKHDEDMYITIRDAFNAMERQLEEYGRKRHGRVKTHNNLLHGHVTRMMPEEGYGFIQGVDGNDYYFSMTNVAYPNFAALSIGDAVEYMAEVLSEGRQAHHVVRERHNNHQVA